MISEKMTAKIHAMTDYYMAHSEREKLERGVKSIQAQLSEAQEREQSATSLITDLLSRNARSLKPLLAYVDSLTVKGSIVLPVSRVELTTNSSRKRIEVTFTQPVFRGWHTETPYKSFQVCDMQLETPLAPDANHIPDYVTEMGVDLTSLCWDYEDCMLVVWDEDEHGMALHTREPVGLILAKIEAKI